MNNYKNLFPSRQKSRLTRTDVMQFKRLFEVPKAIYKVEALVGFGSSYEMGSESINVDFASIEAFAQAHLFFYFGEVRWKGR
jgi:hypothetical protein